MKEKEAKTLQELWETSKNVTLKLARGYRTFVYEPYMQINDLHTTIKESGKPHIFYIAVSAVVPSEMVAEAINQCSDESRCVLAAMLIGGAIDQLSTDAILEEFPKKLPGVVIDRLRKKLRQIHEQIIGKSLLKRL